MNLGNISTVACVNVPPPADTRCDDDAFRLANPTICPPAPRFIIKPGLALICTFGSIQFKAFTVESGVETDVTENTIFTSSDPSVVLSGAISGNATGISEGSATVSAAYQDSTAQAELTVLLGDDCCNEATVAMMVVVDQSRSMKQNFNAAYATKLHYARAAASNFIGSVNESKDLIGLERFTSESSVVLSAPVADKDSVASLVSGIAQTDKDTSFFDAITSATAALSLVTADRRVLVLISDGEDTTPSYVQFPNPMAAADDFKDAGGLVICLGVRAHGPGYELLSALSTGGFFINAYNATAATSLAFLNNLRGYICAGNCAPDGDVYENHGALNYDGFANWDVVDGSVDLLGNGFIDLLPGNGLYVDLVSGMQSGGYANGILRTKIAYSITAGREYRLTFRLAGNQVLAGNASTVNIKVVSENSSAVLLNQNIALADYAQNFHSYSLAFVPSINDDVKVLIQQTGGFGLRIPTDASQFSGALLGEFKLESNEDSMMLHDDFNSENSVYVPPKCGYGTVYQETGVEATSLTLSGSGGYVDGPYEKVSDTLWNYVAGTGYIIFDADSGYWHVWAPDWQPFLWMFRSLDLITWEIGGGEGSEPLPVGEFGDFQSSYGYLTGYNCYGDGCLDSPPPSQSQDPSPLPNLEGGFTPNQSVTSTQRGCAFCANNEANAGTKADATTLVTVEDETKIQLATAIAISRWTAQFNRAWSSTGYTLSVTITLYGSNNGSTWTNLDHYTTPNGMIAGTDISRQLSPVTSAYSYYRTTLSAGVAPAGSGNVVALTVFGTADQLVCKDATASGATRSEAESNALAAAIALAQASLNCARVYSATAVRTAFCLGEPTQAVTKSATANSIISQEDAVRIAGETAQAAADDAALLC